MSENQIPTNDISLCWFCQRATCEDRFEPCEWALDNVPVSGWVTSMQETHESIKGRYTYAHVDKCPKFVPDDKVFAVAIKGRSPYMLKSVLGKRYGMTADFTAEKVFRQVMENAKRYGRMGVSIKKGIKDLGKSYGGEVYQRKKPELVIHLVQKKNGRKTVLQVLKDHNFTVKEAPRARRILRMKDGVLTKIGYERAERPVNKCRAYDCIYASGLRGGSYSKKKYGAEGGHCCGYLHMTGKLRTIERVGGKVIRKNLIVDGKCDQYRPDDGEGVRISAEESDSDFGYSHHSFDDNGDFGDSDFM